MNPRGACPTLLTPMQTGDGLLARIIPQRSISVDALITLCDAADEYGNGIIEVTQRGSLQMRGLSEDSAPKFARVIADLEIAADDGPPLITSPLLGLDPGEPFDATGFVASLRDFLSQRRPALKSLGPKVSLLIDGGGRLHLDAIAADVRLVAKADSTFQVAIAGDAGTAVSLGSVSVGGAPAAVLALLEQIANRGPSARARDLVSDIAQGSGPERRATAASTAPPQHASQPRPSARCPAEPVGTHRLTTGDVALGIALPFGHTTASALARFARAAGDNGATSIRPAPGRSLLAIALTAAENLRESAAAEGFVVDPHDARRHVVACAGMPACASAKLPTRQMAPDIARATQSLAGTSEIVHLSGCSKGCAHPGPAALTIVGPNHIILNGRASDPPHTTLTAAGAIATIEKLCTGLRHV